MAAARALLVNRSVPLENPILRMLVPLWGVAFVAGFVITAFHH